MKIINLNGKEYIAKSDYDELEKKQKEKSKQEGACKEHLDRMEFLSNGNDVYKKINKWVNGVAKDEFWFYEKKRQKLILHKAIQQGIQLALDINKEKVSEGGENKSEIYLKGFKSGWDLGKETLIEFLEFKKIKIDLKELEAWENSDDNKLSKSGRKE